MCSNSRAVNLEDALPEDLILIAVGSIDFPANALLQNCAFTELQERLE